NTGQLQDCYATGAVAGGRDGAEGGLLAVNFGTIARAYSIGLVSAKRNSFIGGLLGIDHANQGIGESYWDLDTSGVSQLSQGAGSPPNDPGITGLSDAQLKAGLPRGFDSNVWGQSAGVNNGYPYLLANPPQ